jgi:hypothetical protein
MEFGTEWENIIDLTREYQQSRANLNASSNASSQAPSSVEVSKGSGQSSFLTPLATAVSIPIGLYCLSILRNRHIDTLECYKGSCHCNSVQFEIVATEKLKVETSPSGDTYNDAMHKYVRVRTSKFEITRGHDLLTTYYVDPRPGTYQQKRMCARAFCRRCGIHILYAPSKSSSIMHVNYICISPSAFQKPQQKLPTSSKIVGKTLTDGNQKLMIFKTGFELSKFGHIYAQIGQMWTKAVGKYVSEAYTHIRTRLPSLTIESKDDEEGGEINDSDSSFSSTIIEGKPRIRTQTVTIPIKRNFVEATEPPNTILQ